MSDKLQFVEELVKGVSDKLKEPLNKSLRFSFPKPAQRVKA